MSLAELLLAIGLVVVVYLGMRPVQRWLENKLLALQGRASGRKGQGTVYTIKRPTKEEDH